MNRLLRTTFLMITCSPIAAFALGVGGAGVNVGTHTGVAAGGNGGLLGTGVGVNTRTNADVNSDVDARSGANADTGVNARTDNSVHERVMNSMQTGETGGNVDVRSTTATDLSNEQRKKRLHNLRALKSSSTTDIDSNLATSPAPLGVDTKANVGVGVESRMPGAAGR